jgi:uncharacterized protein (TIGR00304 family)
MDDAMRWLRWLGISAMVAGAILFVYGIYLGEVVVAVVAIFPVLISDGAIGAAAMLLLVLGLMALVLSYFFVEGGEVGTSDRQGALDDGEERKMGFGGVVLIGPVPIIFGSDRRTALIAAGLAIMVLAIVILLLSLR